ncbi:hypothetical protein niasHT_024879 [Heterodera trifolii]|uniref:Caspase family p20 domain-containing protein n=1 Tax=Heterodera trifolii TaxID=157864 RepID=A0ABD2KFE9_9BILA
MKKKAQAMKWSETSAKSSLVYTVPKSRERGLALIINNEEYEDVSMTRHGSNADVESMLKRLKNFRIFGHIPMETVLILGGRIVHRHSNQLRRSLIFEDDQKVIGNQLIHIDRGQNDDQQQQPEQPAEDVPPLAVCRSKRIHHAEAILLAQPDAEAPPPLIRILILGGRIVHRHSNQLRRSLIFEDDQKVIGNQLIHIDRGQNDDQQQQPEQPAEDVPPLAVCRSKRIHHAEAILLAQPDAEAPPPLIRSDQNLRREVLEILTI